MSESTKYPVLGINIDAVNYAQAVERIIRAAKDGKPCATSALAVHGVMTGFQDPEHAARLNSLDLVVPDGQPVRWALNLLYKTGLSDRVYGPTLTLKVCQAAAEEGLPIYLYGSRESVLNAFSENLLCRFPGLRIAGQEPSRFRRLSEAEFSETAERITASGARIVLVGLGCPRQEVWAYEYSPYLAMPVLAVGAAFDFHAGALSQAPPWMQRTGLEWLFRLIHEPGRLWKRYLILNPLYVFHLLLQMTGVRKKEIRTASDGLNSPERLRYG